MYKPQAFGWYSQSLLLLLVSFLLVAQQRSQAVPYFCVHQSSQKDKKGSYPVQGGERVPEVQDGEDEADKLPQSHHQCDCQGGALCGQDEDPTYANVLSYDIHEEVEPQYG